MYSNFVQKLGLGEPRHSLDSITLWELAMTRQERMLYWRGGKPEVSRAAWWAVRTGFADYAGNGLGNHVIHMRGRDITILGQMLPLGAAVNVDEGSGSATIYLILPWSEAQKIEGGKYDRELGLIVSMLRNTHPSVLNIWISVVVSDYCRSLRKAQKEACEVLSIPSPAKPVDLSGELAKAIDDFQAMTDVGVSPNPKYPECVPSDRWAIEGGFVVKAPGGARAIRVFDTEAGAKYWREEYIGKGKGKEAARRAESKIEHRIPESARCMDYCFSSHVCPQWKIDPTNPENKRARNNPRQGA